jgi:arylamine N-acetyltransferase
MAASIDGGRRHTLLNARHTIRESGREPVVRMLRTAAELEEVLERAMGIRVPRSSVLRSKFEALIGRG